MDSKAMAQWMEQLKGAQAAMEALRATGESGGGLVRVTVDGTGAVLEVKLDPLCVDPRDVPMLEALVRAATNQALARVREAATGGGLDQMFRQVLGGAMPGSRGG